MAQNFYIGAQNLLEEFHKRELHYQGTERKLRNNMIYKKECNIPLQEYLQKINQREKETEETCRSIMKQMDELDRQTDSMMLNFEKIEFLKNSLANLSVPNWQSDLVNLQISSTPQTFSSGIGNHRLKSFESNFLSGLEKNLKSTSTQTENFPCEECGCFIKNQSNCMVKNAPESSSSIQSGINDKIQDSTNFQSNSYFLHESRNNSNFITSSVKSNFSAMPVNIEKSNDSEFIIPSVNSNLSFMPVNVNKSFASENFKEEQMNEESHGQSSNQELQERLNSAENKVDSNHSTVINKSNKGNLEEKVKECDNLVENYKNRETIDRNVNECHSSPEIKAEFNNVREINTKSDVSKKEEKIIESQNSENEFYESKSETEINIDTAVFKSDAESINNEFDFLEKDTQNRSSKINKESSKDYKLSSSNIKAKPEKAPSFLVEHSEKISTKQKKIKSTVNLNSKSDLDDERSVTSGNVSSPHSPNLSLASDSDSFYDKESPVKMSDAYQALLRNTVIPTTVKREASVSESEDEVENALATVIQKSTVRPKSSEQPKKDKPVPQVVEPKPVVKKSQLRSGSKPQSKLSKSVRKALTSDTSSGSEVELTKITKEKIDDDSEFSYN